MGIFLFQVKLKMDATDLGDQLQTCPYDKSHRILKSRFTAHLVHCRQNNPRLKRRNVKVCPYDPYHVVEAADFEVIKYHVTQLIEFGVVGKC